MSILGITLVLGVVIFFIMPMWSIVACDFWRSVVFNDGVKMEHPWIVTLLGPTIMSAICIGLAHIVNFNIWLAIGLCLICVVNGMMTGFGALFTRKNDSCEFRIVIAYFAVILMVMFFAMETLSRVGQLSIGEII